MRTLLALIETGGPGGAETVFVELLRSLDPGRWRGIAVVPYTGWLHDRLLEAGIETHVLPEHHTVDLAFLARIASIIRRNRVDLIHGHLLGASVRAALLSHFLRIPALGTLHGIADLASKERFLGIKRGLLRTGLSRVAFVSDSLRHEFLAHVPFAPDRVVVIPNGVDAARFTRPRNPAFRASLGIGAEEFVVGSVGNLNAAKGFDVLLQAAALLNRSAQRFRVVIVGDTNGRQSAELFALRDQLGLADRVTFTGFRSDIPEALAALDAYVLTSRSEGFSISIVEAMAAGLPVVATRCGGPEEIVRDRETGMLVQNGSPDAVAQAIDRLRVDPVGAARLGAAARADVERRFTLGSQTAAYERLYEACLQPGTPGPRVAPHGHLGRVR